METYDIVSVGGGIGGSAFAKAMAERGYRVLIVEREPRFRDRVRGEFMFPWGVAEAKELGVYDALMEGGARHPAFWTDYAGPRALPPRDFAEDTPQKVRGLCMYHPRLQEAALQAAIAAGADVRRGARGTPRATPMPRRTPSASRRCEQRRPGSRSSFSSPDRTVTRFVRGCCRS